MKKLFAFLLCCVLFLALCLPLSVSAQNDNNIEIPFTLNWVDGDNADALRPDSVAVKLYAYSGAFDSTTAALLDTRTVTPTGWSTTFSVLESNLRNSDGNLLSLRVVADEVTGYIEDETAHKDPTLEEKALSTDSSWDKTEQCNKLFFPLKITEKTVIVAKKGNDYYFWTFSSLNNEIEKQTLFDNAADKKTGIKGFGQGDFNKAHFFYGVDAKCDGLKVEKNGICFDDPSAWSFFATGTYTPAHLEATRGTITYKLDITDPSPSPSTDPSPSPSTDPSPSPSTDPSPSPSTDPSPSPSTDPSPSPSTDPSPSPSTDPSPSPSTSPSGSPSADPSTEPSSRPTATPAPVYPNYTPAPTQPPVASAPAEDSSPKTGDSSDALLALLTVSAGALFLLLRRRLSFR